jgi:hypothetical protein
MKKIVLLMLLACASCYAQYGNTFIRPSSGAPASTSCAFNLFVNDTTNGNLYFCSNGVLTAINGIVLNGTFIDNVQFSNSTPSAVTGGVNVLWQTDGMNVSAYVALGALPAGTAICSTDTLSPCLTFGTGGVTLNGNITATSFISNDGFNSSFSFSAGASGAHSVVASTVQIDAPSTGIQVAGYKFDLPGTEPTANQVLACSSITSHVCTGGWAAPGGLSVTWETFEATFDGGGAALAAATYYFDAITANCTITSTSSRVTTGSAVFTFWNRPTGTAGDPTVGDIISNAGITTVSGTPHNTNASDFTAGTGVTVTALDKLAVHIVPDGTATVASIKGVCTLR